MRFTRSPRRVDADAVSRRDALRILGFASGAAALAPWIASCGDGSTAAASSPLRPEDLDIETIVIVMMENRSFDHYFGALSLLEGRPVDGLPSGIALPRPDGSLVEPFRMDERCVADPPHGWESSRRQVNGGANDGFVREHFARVVEREGFPPATGDQTLGYHDRSQLPLLYSLADEFALCERWFCSVLGPTWPNRMFLHSAQSNGRMNNAFPEDLVAGFTWPTIYDRLGDAGIDWKGYFGDLSFLLLWGRLRNQTARLVEIETFFDDARSGRLPPVCSVEPNFFGPAANDDHPPHDFARGQAFLSSVIHAVAQGPQWDRSLILVTYDEHGGFYDHVPPPSVDDERAADDFDQLGVRVPGLVISPYTRPGYVSSKLVEHSSAPAFIEWIFGLPPLGIRDAQAGFFLDTFDVGRIHRRDPRPLPALPILDLHPDLAAECLDFDENVGGGQELAAFADAAPIPSSLDRRNDSGRILERIQRELIRMGGARLRR